MNGVANTATFHCAAQGRWNFDYAVCTQYIAPTTSSTFLGCVATKCTADAARASPCGTCTTSATDGITAKVADAAPSTGTTDVCIANGIVDFCDVYVTATTDSDPKGCRTCLTGYELVDTDISRDLANNGATPDTKLKICLPSTLKDANC